MPLHKKEKSSPSLSRSQDRQVMLAQKKKNMDLRNSLQRMERDSNAEEEEEILPVIDPENLKEALKKLNVKFTDVEETPTFNHDAVLKINCTQQSPDWTMPWQSLDVADARGSGAVIEGGLVLTAAHVIADFTYIELERVDNSAKVVADVVGICNDSDLALLKPSNSNFLKGITPLKIGDMPSHRDHIYVAGFPIGGEDISVTEGVVSRIELQAYSHSLKNLLAITVDAAINSGNSGGPVMNQKGELVGVAFQALEGAEAIGHIVPPFVIRHFLSGIQKFGDKYQGFPDFGKKIPTFYNLGVELQTLENPEIRKHLGLKDEQTGVMITKITFGTSAFGILKEGDVLLKMDEYTVANNGTISFAKNIHGDISLAAHKHHVGESMQVEIFRNGTVQTVTVPLQYENPLVPLHQYNVSPPYYLYCGVLFQPLSFDLLERFFQSMMAAPQELLFLSGEDKTKERSEIVVLTRVFRDEANFGYEAEIFSVITEVNGEKISCLKDMIQKIENPKTQSTALDPKNEEKEKGKNEIQSSEITIFKTSKSSLIILPSASKKSFKHATKRISKQYNIKEDRYVPE